MRLDKERRALEHHVPGKMKMRLLDVLKMEQIGHDVNNRIDGAGMSIYSLTDGSMVKDAGKAIYFGVVSEEIAARYAAAKWGKGAVSES